MKQIPKPNDATARRMWKKKVRATFSGVPQIFLDQKLEKSIIHFTFTTKLSKKSFFLTVENKY